MTRETRHVHQRPVNMFGDRVKCDLLKVSSNNVHTEKQLRSRVNAEDKKILIMDLKNVEIDDPLNKNVQKLLAETHANTKADLDFDNVKVLVQKAEKTLLMM